MYASVTSWLQRASARLHARASAQEGFALLEILISAVLLAIIVIATLTGFDAAGRITTDQQHRAQANQLAQQDEDRLRSLQVGQLPVQQTRTVTLSGTNFTVKSVAQFTSDSSGTSSCAANGTADYVKTSSTVTWPTIDPTRPPVIAESIITPPVGGSLVVQVVDRQGNGVGNMAVTASGPSNASATTTTAGCAIFGGLTAGTYNVSVAQAGYVDKDGNTSPPANQQSTTVVSAATDRITFQFDQAGQIATTFDTKYGGVVHPSSADTIVMFNNNMTLPSTRWAGTLNSYASTVTGSGLFPFTSAYTVYAGSCTKNAPTQNGQGTDQSVVVPPGAAGSLLIHLPAMLLKVWTGTSSSSPGTGVNRPHVALYDLNCGGNPPSAGGSPSINRYPATTTTGTLADPGQPYGTYFVCADNGSKASWISSLANNDPVNGVTANIYLGNGVNAVCP